MNWEDDMVPESPGPEELREMGELYAELAALDGGAFLHRMPRWQLLGLRPYKPREIHVCTG